MRILSANIILRLLPGTSGKKDGQFSKLTDFPGEDRNPVWAPDGKRWFYLS